MQVIAKLFKVRGWRRLLLLLTGALTAILAVVAVLFLINGLWFDQGAIPLVVNYRRTSPAPLQPGDELRVVSYNIAKVFVFKDGDGVESVAAIKARVKALADAIRSERPDLVFVSEAVKECGPCPVDQVALLASELDMNCTAFGENYCFGLPFFRVVGGNAILSRWPLEPVLNMDLAGRKPFYATKNNRRALWCRIELAGTPVLLASLHNDTFSGGNNLEQTKQLLAFARDRGPSLLAGDFNAKPDSPSLQTFRESGMLTGIWSGPPTFPSDHPDRTIDYILAPADWEIVEHKVIASIASDHCPILTVFRLPADLPNQ